MSAKGWRCCDGEGFDGELFYCRVWIEMEFLVISL